MKIPNYYCPNCKKYRKRYQISARGEFIPWYTCRYCDTEVIRISEWVYNKVNEVFGNKESMNEDTVNN